MNEKIELAIAKAEKLRLLEEEVGTVVAPFINDRNRMHEIAVRSRLRTNYLIELGKVAAGMRRRHRPVIRDI